MGNSVINPFKSVKESRKCSFLDISIPLWKNDLIPIIFSYLPINLLSKIRVCSRLLKDIVEKKTLIHEWYDPDDLKEKYSPNSTSGVIFVKLLIIFNFRKVYLKTKNGLENVLIAKKYKNRFFSKIFISEGFRNSDIVKIQAMSKKNFFSRFSFCVNRNQITDPEFHPEEKFRIISSFVKKCKFLKRISISRINLNNELLRYSITNFLLRTKFEELFLVFLEFENLEVGELDFFSKISAKRLEIHLFDDKLMFGISNTSGFRVLDETSRRRFRVLVENIGKNKDINTFGILNSSFLTLLDSKLFDCFSKMKDKKLFLKFYDYSKKIIFEHFSYNLNKFVSLIKSKKLENLDTLKFNEVDASFELFSHLVDVVKNNRIKRIILKRLRKKNDFEFYCSLFELLREGRRVGCKIDVSFIDIKLISPVRRLIDFLREREESKFKGKNYPNEYFFYKASGISRILPNDQEKYEPEFQISQMKRSNLLLLWGLFVNYYENENSLGKRYKDVLNFICENIPKGMQMNVPIKGVQMRINEVFYIIKEISKHPEVIHDCVDYGYYPY